MFALLVAVLVALAAAGWHAPGEHPRIGRGRGAVRAVLLAGRDSGRVCILVGTELIYLRDVFGSRMNTVFKFQYHAWLLFGVGERGGARADLADPAAGTRAGGVARG